MSALERNIRAQQVADAYVTIDDALSRLRTYIDTEYGGNQTVAANAFGVSRSYMSHVLSGDCVPNDEMLSAVGLAKRRVTVIYNPRNLQ